MPPFLRAGIICAGPFNFPPPLWLVISFSRSAAPLISPRRLVCPGAAVTATSLFFDSPLSAESWLTGHCPGPCSPSHAFGVPSRFRVLRCNLPPSLFFVSPLSAPTFLTGRCLGPGSASAPTALCRVTLVSTLLRADPALDGSCGGGICCWRFFRERSGTRCSGNPRSGA